MVQRRAADARPNRLHRARPRPAAGDRRRRRTGAGARRGERRGQREDRRALRGLSRRRRRPSILAPAGSPETAYAVYADTGKESAGLIELKLPPEPGAYEVRAIIGGRWRRRRRSASPRRRGERGHADAGEGELAPGETIVIAFSGMGGARATMSAFRPRARATANTSHVYTKGAKEGGPIEGPGRAGAYEIRAFFNEDESVLRSVAPVEVKAAP